MKRFLLTFAILLGCAVEAGAVVADHDDAGVVIDALFPQIVEPFAHPHQRHGRDNHKQITLTQ